MTWVDIGLIVAIFLGGWRGRRRGFGIEVCHAGSAMVGLVVGFRTAPALAAAADARLGVEQSIAYVIAFILTAGTISGVGIALAPRVDALLARSRAGRRLHQWGGFVAGASKSALLLFILIVASVQLPWQAANRALFESPVALWMLRAAPAVYQTIPFLIGDEPNVVNPDQRT